MFKIFKSSLCYYFLLIFLAIPCSAFDKSSELIADEVTGTLNVFLCGHEIDLIKEKTVSYISSSRKKIEENKKFISILNKIDAIWDLSHKRGDIYTYFSGNGYAEPDDVAYRILNMYKYRLTNMRQPLDVLIKEDLRNPPRYKKWKDEFSIIR